MPEMTAATVLLAGRSIPYTLRHSERARRLRISVSAQGVTVTFRDYDNGAAAEEGEYEKDELGRLREEAEALRRQLDQVEGRLGHPDSVS